MGILRDITVGIGISLAIGIIIIYAISFAVEHQSSIPVEHAQCAQWFEYGQYKLANISYQVEPSSEGYSIRFANDENETVVAYTFAGVWYFPAAGCPKQYLKVSKTILPPRKTVEITIAGSLTRPYIDLVPIVLPKGGILTVPTKDGEIPIVSPLKRLHIVPVIESSLPKNASDFKKCTRIDLQRYDRGTYCLMREYHNQQCNLDKNIRDVYALAYIYDLSCPAVVHTLITKEEDKGTYEVEASKTILNTDKFSYTYVSTNEKIGDILIFPYLISPVSTLQTVPYGFGNLSYTRHITTINCSRICHLEFTNREDMPLKVYALVTVDTGEPYSRLRVSETILPARSKGELEIHLNCGEKVTHVDVLPYKISE